MDNFFENELVDKFEEMLQNDEIIYFDSDELEEIIIHYLELGDILFAEKAVKFALKLHPNSIEIKVKKLEVLLELGHYPEAKELIKELQGTSMETPDFMICCAKYYSNLGNPKKAIEYCEKALPMGEEENFLYVFIADEYINLGDPSKALYYYKSALNADPQDDYALENIISCYNQLNKSTEAIIFLNEYLDNFPFSETAWFEYGQFYFNRKNYQEAIKGFDYLIAINPSAINVYSNKAACFEALNEFEKAISVYEEMLELEYTKAFTYYKIGLCYKAMKKMIPALYAFQKSLKEDPQFYLSMIEQSFLYEEMGKPNEALHFAKEAVYHNNTSIDFHKRLAYLYINSDLFEESLDSLNFIIEQEPDKFYNWYVYIEILMLLDEYTLALEVLEKAIKVHDKAEFYYQISNCWYHLENHNEYIKSLQKAIKKNASITNDIQQKYPYMKNDINKNLPKPY